MNVSAVNMSSFTGKLCYGCIQYMHIYVYVCVYIYIKHHFTPPSLHTATLPTKLRNKTVWTAHKPPRSSLHPPQRKTLLQLDSDEQILASDWLQHSAYQSSYFLIVRSRCLSGHDVSKVIIGRIQRVRPTQISAICDVCVLINNHKKKRDLIHCEFR